MNKLKSYIWAKNMKFSLQLPYHSRWTINCHSYKITWQSKLLKKVLVKCGTYTHYARRYTSNGMIHVQHSFREIARELNKFWLVESWFLDTRSSGSIYVAHRNDFRPIRIQDTECLLASDWLKIVPLCDVSAAAGPCIQKSTFNQSELFKRTRIFAEWPLDMYHSVGHVSPCVAWYRSIYFF